MSAGPEPSGTTSPAAGNEPRPHPRQPEIALLPEARAVFADLVSRSLDHRWALHHCSSQAFALNLFAPLDHQRLCAVLARVGLPASSVEQIDFEYSDPADRFGEIRPKSAHQTQIDVVVRGTSAAGDRLVALIEVKFTETDFGHCSAYQNPANPRHDVCRSPGLFGGEPAACFQLANHGDGRRTYYDHLAKIPVVAPFGAGDAGGCLVRESLSQPMRSLALAHLLLNAGEADRVAYVLCAPAQHPTIWRRFAELRAAFPDADGRTSRALASEQVACSTSMGERLSPLATRSVPSLRRPPPRSKGSPASSTVTTTECWRQARTSRGLARGRTCRGPRKVELRSATEGPEGGARGFEATRRSRAEGRGRRCRAGSDA